MNANVNKTNGVKLLAVIAILAMVVCVFAAVMPAEETDAAPAKTQYYSGELDGVQTFDVGTNVVIDKDLTITTNGVMNVKGGNFTINEGVVVTIEKGGQLNVDGGLVTIDGEVLVTGTGANTNVAGTNADSPSTLNIKGETIAGVPTFEKSGVVVNGSVEIAKGAAFTATNGSILINNNGSVEVTRSGNNISTMSGVQIYIAVGGTFGFNGKATADITVNTYGNGTVYSIGSAIINPDTVNADPKDTSKLTFTNTSSNFTGYYLDDQDKVATQNIRQYALTISGSVANYDDLKLSGAVYETANDIVSNATETYYTSENAAKQAKNGGTPVMYYNDIVAGNSLITGTLTVEKTSGFTVESTSYLVVSGTLSLKDTVDDNDNIIEKVKIDGKIEVTGTVTLNANTVVSNTFGTIAVNGGAVTVADFGDYAGTLGLYGAYYVDSDDNAYITDLATAISGAVTAQVDEVSVWGTYLSNNDVNGYGSYIIDSEITVPAGITVYIGSGAIIAEGTTVTFEPDSSVEFETDLGKIFVNGKLIDQSLEFEGFEVSGEMQFEVKSVSDDELTNTYTTLATALSETTSGTIYLYDDVKIDGTMTIAPDVTVQYAADNDLATENKSAGITFADKDAVLNIDGTLYINGTHTLSTSTGTVGENGTVNINNMVVFDSQIAPATLGVDGVYFDKATTIGDYEDKYFVTSPAVAAENSSTYNGTMTVYGEVSMGDLTFTEGEDNELIIVISNQTDDVTTAGTITLVGGVQFQAGANCKFTGTVQSDVSAGMSSIQFEEATYFEVTVDSEENADGTSTTTLTLTGHRDSNAADTVKGNTNGTITIAGGSVSLVQASGSEAYIEKLIVAENATLVITEGSVYQPADPKAQDAPSSLPVYNSEIMEGFATFQVDGTLVINGTVKEGYILINGNVTVGKTGLLNGIDAMVINGTLAAGDNTSNRSGIVLVNGTLSGNITSNAVIAFVGSDVSEAKINYSGDRSTAKTTTYYVNGDEYATVYAIAGINVSAFTLFSNIAGVDVETAQLYSDEGMNNKIGDLKAFNAAYADKPTLNLDTLLGYFGTGKNVGDYANVYVSMDASKVKGSITVYQGMNLYIDGKSIDSFMVYNETTKTYEYELSVGTHQFAVQVDPGFTGTPVVTLDGQTVTGSFTIDNNAKTFQIVVTGDISQDVPVVDGGNGDDGMGLTDYLLIILVVLIVIMAIMVAMRLMRS